MSTETQDSGPTELPVHVRRYTEPLAVPPNIEQSSSSSSDDNLERPDLSAGAPEHATSDPTGLRGNQEGPHSEPDANPSANPSAAANAAAASLGAQKKPPRRHGDSSHGKRHREPRRPQKMDRPFTWGFKSDKSGPDPSKEHLLIEIRERDQALDDLDDDLYRSDKANKKLKREISDLARENEKLQRLLDDQDDQIRTVQDHQLRKVEAKGFLHAEDDRTVRQKLRTLTNRWKSWGREYAVRSLDQITAAETANATALFQNLWVPEELLSSKFSATAPGIILHAALSKFVTTYIFRQPFFCLPSGLRTEGEAGPGLLNVASAFDFEYERALRMNDVSLAHSWRSLTLQLLDPPEHESRSRPEIYQESLRRKDQFYHHMRKKFDDNHRSLYRQAHPAQREKELYEILRSAGELFSSLWKQKVFIESRLDYYHRQPFSIASTEMEAHPAQRIEEGDTRRDGVPVQMVVQPGVLAFGNEDGKQYNEFKVWAKAVVWIGSGQLR